MSGKKKSFYFYFKDNMESLGLQAPSTLFGSLNTAIVNITALSLAVETIWIRRYCC